MAKRITLNIPDELVPWVDFAAGLMNGNNVTAYINDAIRRDRDGASGPVKTAYEAVQAAKKEVNGEQ
jgi:hypothetical protein